MSRKPYNPPVPLGWWLEKPFYIAYMLREMTSFFVLTYSATLIVGLWRLSMGPEAWAGFVSVLTSPVMVVYQVVALAFAIYHTITWFAVTPRTTPIMIGEDFVPPAPIIIGQYVVWAAVSVFVVVLAAMV